MKGIRFKALLMVLILLFVSNSCQKDNKEYDHNETIITLNASNLNAGYSFYMVVENSKSSPSFCEIIEGETSITRGNEIIGDIINLHIIGIVDTDWWMINSYYDIPIGKEIDLPDMFTSSKSTVNESNTKGSTNISFSDIPEFDVATRSAAFPAHCHTSETLEVPCANIGGNTYNPGDNFYVCLQSGINAGYKLVSIPDVAEYIISLDELNGVMTKYSIARNPDYPYGVDVTASGIDGDIGIFHLNSPDIFTGDFVDIFVPDGLSQMQTFTTRFSHSLANGSQDSHYINNEVATSYSFLDVGLGITHPPGELPVVSAAKDTYDYLQLAIIYNGTGNHQWNIYAPDGQSIYTPEFPEEALKAISDDFELSQFLTSINAIIVTAINDSRLSNYNDAFEYFLNIRDFAEDNYQVLRERRFFLNY